MAGAGAYEGVCYFQVERITDAQDVRMIVESIAENHPAVTILETADGDAMVLTVNREKSEYLLRKLYVADGNLMHRDWFFNTSLGPVVFEQNATEK